MPTITLQVVEGVDRGRVYRDLNLPVTIGRNEDNTIQLNDERISRYHAKFQFEDGDVIVTDLDSVNGTLVNGAAVQIRRLKPGDRIALGRSMLVYGNPEDSKSRTGRATSELGNVREIQCGDPGVANLLDECAVIRRTLETTSAFCKNADSRGLTSAVLDSASRARAALAEGFDRVVVVDAARGRHPETDRFEPTRFLVEVCRTLGETYGLDLDPVRFHSADVFQVMKDERPSLFVFVHFECVAAESFPLARAFTQGNHRALFLNDGEPSPIDDEDVDADESVLAETFVQSAGSAAAPAESLERLRKLILATTAIASSGSVRSFLNEIADTCLQEFRYAERCFVVLSDAGRFSATVTKTRRPADALDANFSRAIVRACMKSKAVQLSDDAYESSGGVAQSIVELRTRATMCTPLFVSDGTAIGALLIDTQDRNRKFVPDDAKTLQSFASLAAAAIEKGRLLDAQLVARELQRDLDTARNVQLRLQPCDLPVRPGYAFHALDTAARGVSGDFAYFLDRPDGTVVGLLGDVIGKGVPAGLILSRLIGEIHHCFANQHELSRTVEAINNEMIRSGVTDSFVTMIAMVLDPKTHRVTIINAGHIAPRRLRTRDLTFDEAISTDLSGLPLGILENFEYTAVELELEPGDRLIAFTDGVTDVKSTSEKLFGDAGVAGALNVESLDRPYASPKEICEGLLAAVRTHSQGCPPLDDIGILCLGRERPTDR